MRIAFVHHHFRPGGVTKVISDQMNALKGSCEMLLITGEPPSIRPSFPCVVTPEIAYDRDRKDKSGTRDIAYAIVKAASDVWPGGADLYHFHNPLLGKNKDLISALKILVAEKNKLLLQIHDFAEDGRPGGYSFDEYPTDSHYAVINKRDYKILLRSGLKEEGLHFIPNAVRSLQFVEHENVEKNVVLYPIRAIRRKNIGEAIFLSLFIGGRVKVGFSLEPTGPIDVKSYNDWKTFAREKHLKILFGLGIKYDYATVLAKTCSMITTSIKEGFGFSFLEPWTANRMLFGRTLKEICADFMNRGIDLSHLYDFIKVPLSFFDGDCFKRKWISCYRDKLIRYGIEISEGETENSFHRIIDKGWVDFGVLSEDLQRQVILNILDDKLKQKKILDLNPSLGNINVFNKSTSIIKQNKRIIEEEYSLEKSKQTLLGVYKRVLEWNITQSIDKRVLFHAFNIPENNYLLICDSSYD